MSKPTLAIVGGTGAEGTGLGVRWAAAGYPVIIGSRSTEKAMATAAELQPFLSQESASLRGDTNLAAVNAAEIVILSVPYSAQESTLQEIAEACQGKTLITVVVPLQRPKVSTVWHPAGGSAAEEAQTQLGPGVRVVAAFHNISSGHLKDLAWEPNCDVLVAGDNKEAKQMTLELAQAAGFFALDAGALVNASVVEGLTAVLVGINIRNKVKDSGIRITGIPRTG
jgi:8-hydroxy-5-deazaflavin:NADPH oxidoreductase